MQYHLNPDLKIIKTGYYGNPYRLNRFVGPYTSQNRNLYLKGLVWVFSSIWSKKNKKKDTYRLKVHQITQFPELEQNCIIWLGHASFYIQLNGVRIICDPCLTAPPFVKRICPVPVSLDKLQVDYLLLSHGHYDHFDKKSIRMLARYPIEALVPLNMGRLLHAISPKIRIQEAAWYQQYKTRNHVDIFFLPAHHWHRRHLTDTNKVLWGSFLIRTSDITIYFAGDTAYNQHFSEIQNLFKRIDYAILPIGAYDPPFIMRNNHMNPEQAIHAFTDLNARYLIPMHYGTFDLTNETYGAPVRWLNRLKDQDNLYLNNKIIQLNPGIIYPF
ncbi:MAG: MBL fold metallo-hydrolase [Desulfobacterales bacterium]|nr:MBL fold metallo-hydrolase [Desulfobacterales bacterium]